MAGVQEYLDKHGLQKKVEDVLNMAVKSRPEEPLSFMVRVTGTRPCVLMALVRPPLTHRCCLGPSAGEGAASHVAA